MLLGSSLFFVGGTLLLSAEKVVGQTTTTTTTTTTTSTTPLTYTSPPPALGLYTFAGAVLVEFRFSGAPLAHDDNRLHCDAATHKILPARAAQVLTHGVVRAAISRVIFQQTVADGLSTGPGMATLFWPGFVGEESDAAVRVAWDNLRVFVGSAATQAALSLPSAAAEVLFQGGENGQGSVGNVTCVAGQGLGEPPHGHLPHETVTSSSTSTASTSTASANIAENTFSARFPYFVTQVATEQGPVALAKMEKVACNGSRREPQCLDSNGNPQQSAEYQQFRTELEEMLRLGREDASGFAGGSANGGWFGVPSSSFLLVNDLTSVAMYPTSGTTETSSAGVHLPPTAESAGVSPAIFVVLGLVGGLSLLGLLVWVVRKWGGGGGDDAGGDDDFGNLVGGSNEATVVGMKHNRGNGEWVDNAATVVGMKHKHHDPSATPRDIAARRGGVADASPIEI